MKIMYELLKYLPLLPTQHLSRTLAGIIVLRDTEKNRFSHVPPDVDHTLT